jgi:zinc transporter, ZIP family
MARAPPGELFRVRHFRITPIDLILAYMLIVLLTIAAAIAALAGGFTAIKTRKHLPLAIAITSGLILGLVGFDLLPEIFEGSERSGLNIVWPMALFIGGFLLFHAIEKFILVHEGSEEDYKTHRHPKMGIARAIALAGHSFFDGLSIGIAFQVNISVGIAVTLAVLGHRFADGFDTANFMLLNHNSKKQIYQLIGLVVVAPIAGGLVSLVIPLSEAALTLYLGFFAGVLLYIAASNILPQAHSKAPAYATLGLTIVGVLCIVMLTRMGEL